MTRTSPQRRLHLLFRGRPICESGFDMQHNWLTVEWSGKRAKYGRNCLAFAGRVGPEERVSC
jgi:hypothetical protein